MNAVELCKLNILEKFSNNKITYEEAETMDIALDVLCDTILHVSEIQEALEEMSSELRKRGLAHDRTKFQELEFDAFTSTRLRFKKVDYGTPEYKALVDEIKPVVDHHYANNRHHPNYHEHGINSMTLIDIAEMLADWKVAARRSPNNKFKDTLEFAFNKHGISKQLGQIIKNTLKELNWI